MENQVMDGALHVPWGSIVTTLLAAAFGLWAWVVKSFGEQHIETVKELAKELRAMREDINDLKERVKVVEVLQTRSPAA